MQTAGSVSWWSLLCMWGGMQQVYRKKLSCQSSAGEGEKWKFVSITYRTTPRVSKQNFNPKFHNTAHCTIIECCLVHLSLPTWKLRVCRNFRILCFRPWLVFFALWLASKNHLEYVIFVYAVCPQENEQGCLHWMKTCFVTKIHETFRQSHLCCFSLRRRFHMSDHCNLASRFNAWLYGARWTRNTTESPPVLIHCHLAMNKLQSTFQSGFKAGFACLLHSSRNCA